MNRQSHLIIVAVAIVIGIGLCYAQEEKTKSFTLSDLTGDKIIVTEAIPKYESGKEVRDYNTSFNQKTIDVKNGKAAITLGQSPVFIEIGESYPKASIASYKDSPFGFHPADVSINNYPDNGFIDASNIGVKWARQGLYAFWFLVQPDINLPNYDFSKYDEQWRNIPVNINILANIAVVPAALLRPQGEHKQREEIDSPKRKKARGHVKRGSFSPKGENKQGKAVDSSEREKARGYVKEGSFLPVDEKKYVAFVRAAVERYDGDGISDMPGLKNPIKYWQVGNEPPGGLSDYAEFLKLNYNAIKEACQECKVLIGGVPGMPPASNYLSKFDKSFLPILNELAKLNSRSFDIFDFHWYGNATGDYKGIKEVYNSIKQKIDALGLSPEEYWITEMGSYSGKPSGGMAKGAFLYQTEAQQAGDYLKRFVLPLSLGIKKIFPAFGLAEGFKHNDGYFDHTGLIYDGDGSNDFGAGVKKIAYHTYKLMTEKLEGADWDKIETIIDGTDNIYVYKFNRKDLGKPVYVAWGDYFTEEKREEKRELKKEEMGPRKKSQPSRIGRCGDGICGPVERKRGICPQDCGS